MNNNMNTWEALAYAAKAKNNGKHITVNGRPAMVLAGTISYTDNGGYGRRRVHIRSNNTARRSISAG